MNRYATKIKFTAEGSDNAARLKNLLSKISGFLTENIPHMTQKSSASQSVTLRNTLYGYEITIDGRTSWSSYPTEGGVSLRMGIGNEQTDYLGLGSSYNYDCDITLASIEDLLYQLTITMYYASGGYNHDNSMHSYSITISFGGFTGSYDDKQYYVSRVDNDIQVSQMDINGTSTTWSTSTVPSQGKYILAPYCWYGVCGTNNFGLALFGDNKDKVLYALYGPDGAIVTTDPNLEYVINGQNYRALSSVLIVPMNIPLTAIQKPGEVLVWPEQ